LFEEQVEKTPDNIAVVFEDKQLTYRELNSRANSLAGVLRDKGAGTDSIVGIMLERSLEMIIGIMAILKAGGAYLPIDPGYPEERIQFMLEDSSTRILLTQSRFKNNASETKCEIIVLEEQGLYTGDGSNLKNVNTSRDLAYVIYTSGSTGKPKGVMIEHYSLANRLNWMQKKYPIGEEDVILQKTPYTLDVSFEDENMVLLKKASSICGNLFFIHEVSGTVEPYIELCTLLNFNINYWAIRADLSKKTYICEVEIKDIAKEYIKNIKKVQHKGPYSIAGWSLGGNIAFEMACQLEMMGEEVEFLGIIDSPVPISSSECHGKSIQNLQTSLKEYNVFIEGLQRYSLSHSKEETIQKAQQYIDSINYSKNCIRCFGHGGTLVCCIQQILVIIKAQSSNCLRESIRVGF
jgi:hypothetical protein